MSMVELHPFSDAVVVMGVASCGKTTIGEAIAKALAVPFIEGDKLHPKSNVAKMSAGIPLEDEDRWPWLAEVGKSLGGYEGRVASCSALKRSYREWIAKHAQRSVTFIYLHGSTDVLRNRIALRTGHFMPPALLDSQLATLEMPQADETAITINIDQSPDAILREALAYLTAKEKSS